MHQSWYLSSASHPKQAYGPRMSNCIIQDGRHIEICKNLNNSRTVRPIYTKFGTELRHDTAETPEVSKPPFFKIQRCRRKTVNLLKIEYLRNGSSYMHQIWYLSSVSHLKQDCGPRMYKCIIQDDRRPSY